MNIFYVYAYLREDGSPYYIGKGKERRAFVTTNRWAKTPKDASRILFVAKDLDEETSFDVERWMIAGFGRKTNGTGCLWNLTDGGEGPSGMKASDETRQKMSIAHMGNQCRKGIPNSPEVRQLLSKLGRGRKQSETHVQNRSMAMIGKNVGKVRSEEWLAKKSRRWIVSTPSGEEIEVLNLAKFARENGLDPGNLQNTCTGKAKTHKGYRAAHVS